MPDKHNNKDYLKTMPVFLLSSSAVLMAGIYYGLVYLAGLTTQLAFNIMVVVLLCYTVSQSHPKVD